MKRSPKTVQEESFEVQYTQDGSAFFNASGMEVRLSTISKSYYRLESQSEYPHSL